MIYGKKFFSILENYLIMLTMVYLTRRFNFMLVSARYVVIEGYFGKWNDTQKLCYCYCLSDACYLIDSLVSSHSGRPFAYKVEKVSDDFIDSVDDIIHTDFFGNVVDYSKYFDFISCLGV